MEDGALGEQSSAAAIAVLIEGGQMFLFDDHLSPNPLSLDLQELPQLTVSSLESSASSSFGPNAVDVERLQVTPHSKGMMKTLSERCLYGLIKSTYNFLSRVHTRCQESILQSLQQHWLRKCKSLVNTAPWMFLPSTLQCWIGHCNCSICHILTNSQAPS